MKKALLITFLTICIAMAGCGKQEVNEQEKIQISEEIQEEKAENTDAESNKIEEESKFDFEALENVEFYFSSGAGGWRTFLNIEEDGSFHGEYSDSDMGSTGDGYPNGTYYYCEFNGKFTEAVKVNDYTYSMKIEEISCVNEPETSEIIDGILYYYATPYGMEGAEEVLIYLPGAPISELPEEYINWVCNDMVDPDAVELPFYGLYNVTEQNGFSSYDTSGRIEDMIAATEEWALTIRASLEHDTLTQADMNVKAMELYETWDAALNTLWSELKERLSEDEFNVLLEEQRVWIADKEAAVKEAGKKVEGGSLYALVVNMKAAEITEARVYELYEMLKENE